MKIDATTIDAMVSAGLSPEQMAHVLKAHIAAAEEKKAAQREAAAERQRRKRMRDKETVTRDSRDIALQQVTGRDIEPAKDVGACADSITSNLPEVITPSPPKGGSVPKITRLRKPEPDDFDEWYGAYPKHVGRDAAAKAYAAARKRGATRGELFAGAQRYAAERAGQNPEFTKQPATWLNAGCWKDEPTQTFNGSHHGQRSHHRPARIDAAFAAMAEVFGAGDEPGLSAEDTGGPIIDHEPAGRGSEPHRGLRPIDGGRDEPRDWDDRHAASGRLSGGWR